METGTVWQRFTERARKVVYLAQEEAQRRGDMEIAPDHFCLALLSDRDSIAGKILHTIGADCAAMQAVAIGHLPNKADAQKPMEGDMKLSDRAKHLIDIAHDEAVYLKHNYIGTEHLMLGVLREAEENGDEVYLSMGISSQSFRQEIAGFSGIWPPPHGAAPRIRRERKSSSTTPPLVFAQLGMLFLTPYLLIVTLSLFMVFRTHNSASMMYAGQIMLNPQMVVLLIVSACFSFAGYRGGERKRTRGPLIFAVLWITAIIVWMLFRML